MEPNRLLGNRYRCTERLAIGGQGEVWHAWDTRLERAVAIKSLHPSLANDADYRKRFTLEARTVAALNEPAIVDLYDACEDTDGFNTVSYLVMEYVAGQPLSALMREPNLPAPNQVMDWIAQVSRGLQAAHQAGIIHRDIKPANIIIRPDGKATIIDFGIARRDGDPGLTATGKVMGTLSYASPEQLEDRELTGTSDIYSLGAVAYECLSGQRPFEGETPGAVIAGHIGRQPDALPSDVPPAIAEVVMRALRKDPRDRFDDATAFAAAAERATRRRPTPRPGPAPEDKERSAAPPAHKRSRRGLLTAAVVVLLLAAGAGAVVLWPELAPSSANGDSGDDWQGADPGDEMTELTRPPPGEPPESTRLVNAATGSCLDIGSNDQGQEIVQTTDCEEHDDFHFDLTSYEEPPDSFKAADEGGKCVDFESDGKVLPASCETVAVGWTFDWVTHDDDSEIWQLWVVSGSADDPSARNQLCLTDRDKEEPTVQECEDGNDNQGWATELA